MDKNFYAHWTGGTVAFGKFISDYEDLIRDNLDISGVLSALKEKNINVLILPCELFKNDEVRFWSKYETILGVSKPTNLAATKRTDNVTPYENLDLHLAFNQVLKMLTDDARRAGCEVELVQQADFTRKWLGRRALESNNFDPFKFKKYFKKIPEIPQVEPLINKSLRDSIRENYVNELLKHDPNEISFKKYLA